MANTVVKTGKVIDITAIDSDFNLATSYPEDVNPRGECRLRFVQYFGNASDVLIVRNGSDTAAVICTLFVTAENRSPFIDFGEAGLLCKLHINSGDLTVAGTERVTLILA